MTTLEGIFPILATTFHDNGTLDLQSQAKLIRFLLEAGVHGLGLFGNASEGYTLTAEERLTLLKLVRKEVDGGVPIVVSTGSTGTDIAVNLSKTAQEFGASALMILPPYYLRTDADGVMFYFDAISREVRIPIMVQDAPIMTQVTLSPTLLARMEREIERVQYVKVEAPPTAIKVSKVLEASQNRLTVFAGLNGQFMIEEIERGANGVMPGSDMASIYVKIWNDLKNGNRFDAWQSFGRVLPLIRFELQPGMGVSAMKHNLVAVGVIQSARVRHPTQALMKDSVVELEFLRSFANCELGQETVP